MSTRSGPRSPAGQDPGERGPEDQSAFTAILDEHAARVFDYCSRLVGDDAEAASATETVMNAAQTLLADPDRLRAWLFALARQEVAADAQALGQDQDAEIRDLVHRHGIRLEDLPTVLGVSAERARAMLAEAEVQPAMPVEAEHPLESENPAAESELPAELDALAAVDGLPEVGEPMEVDGLAASVSELREEPAEPADDAIVESGESTAGPLAEPPTSWIFDRTVAAFFDDQDIDASGYPVTAEDLASPAREQAMTPFARARRRLGFSAVLVVAAGTAAAGIVYLGGSPAGRADTHDGAQKPSSASAAPVSTPLPTTTQQIRTTSKQRHRHHHQPRPVSAVIPVQPGGGVAPVTSTTTATQPPAGILTPPPHPHHSPTSSPPTIGPSPTPSK